MGTSFCAKSEILVFKQDDSFHNVLSYLYFFCLLKQEGAIKKTEKDPFAWEFFVIFFLHACPHFKSDICKHNRRSHVKLHNILFFKKEKMK